MMRSLWTAASGMGAQQTNIDLIANNMANVNTSGFKRERMEFKSLLYQTMQRASLDPVGGRGPVNLQVGLGVRAMATSRTFDTGNLEITNNNMDFAIDGPGFFAVQRAEEQVAFTRDGNFRLSPLDDGGVMLVTSDGFPILDTGYEPIIIPPEVHIRTIVADQFGNLTFTDDEGDEVDMGFQLAIVQFPNPQGLEAVGNNLFIATPATGEAMMEADGDVTVMSRLIQGAIEMSNVNIADEMVRMIVAQRAFEVNSRIIQVSDEMLSQANNLRRG
ncbi:MAG: flagellar basal-body rod protein FlgG [Defluviitaleaceae bacterium]|nr:flagellar basal-body rod protein FlgG [Defluviitaleaceae bacterium]